MSDVPKILNSSGGLFSRESLPGFAAQLAARYPFVHYWTAGNRPNLSGYFSPEPDVTSVASEYMNLLYFPIRDGVREAIPDAEVFGAELYTCYGGGTGCTQRDGNWNQKATGFQTGHCPCCGAGLMEVWTVHDPQLR